MSIRLKSGGINKMEIQVNKYYKTRDGEKAFVGYMKEKSDWSGEYVGHICHEEEGTALATWFWEGSFTSDVVKGDYRDLVAPWEDVEEVEVSVMWVLVYYSNITETQYDYEDMYISKPIVANNTVAIVTMADWEDIKQGKRNLIIGEGI